MMQFAGQTPGEKELNVLHDRCNIKILLLLLIITFRHLTIGGCQLSYCDIRKALLVIINLR
jgi:hypothetical protein